MSSTYEKIVDRIPTVDQNGRAATVIVYQTVVVVENRSGRSELDGMKRCETSDGDKVNHESDDVFSSPFTGRVYRRVSTDHGSR